MDHRAYYRLMPNADTAVVCIHGIVSTPRHFDWLIPLLPEDVEIHNILLKGHGGTVKDFSKATMRQWQNQIDDILYKIKAKRIYIVGHSLGSLLALNAAKKHSSIHGLLLLNVPLAVRVKASMVSRCFRFPYGKIRRNDPADMRCYRDLGTDLEPNLLKYISWAPNMIALLRLGIQCRHIPKQLSLPCYAYLDTADELVRLGSAKWLQDCPCVTLRYLNAYGHFAYSPEDQQIIADDLRRLIGK